LSTGVSTYLSTKKIEKTSRPPPLKGGGRDIVLVVENHGVSYELSLIDNKQQQTMYTVASSSASITQLMTDSGTLIAVVLGFVLAGAIALVGLGFAWRHLTKRITGKKF